MLRALAAHSKIKVAHDLNATNTRAEQKLVSRVRHGGARLIYESDFAAGEPRPPRGGVILVKNAVWISSFAVPSFTLARNPFASITSIGGVEAAADERRIAQNVPLRLWCRIRGKELPTTDVVVDVREKIGRWARGMDKHLFPYVTRTDPIAALAALYARKMGYAYECGGPILRYENFVKNPEPVLRRLISYFGLEWEDAVLRSHEKYQPGEIGHGGIKLWEPIHDKSADKYKRMSLRDFYRIYSMTADVLWRFGYAVDKEKVVSVEHVHNERFIDQDPDSPLAEPSARPPHPADDDEEDWPALPEETPRAS
ncbi:hypothetical protein [Prosthecomicrobium sp. N25]|uniref:hypothetical protein n=1 Tax=Prosthecomicrobium sp. N25 TaxID=3129254 RepID=UPI003078063B